MKKETLINCFTCNAQYPEKDFVTLPTRYEHQEIEVCVYCYSEISEFVLLKNELDAQAEIQELIEQEMTRREP